MWSSQWGISNSFSCPRLLRPDLLCQPTYSATLNAPEAYHNTCTEVTTYTYAHPGTGLHLFFGGSVTNQPAAVHAQFCLALRQWMNTHFCRIMPWPTVKKAEEDTRALPCR